MKVIDSTGARQHRARCQRGREPAAVDRHPLDQRHARDHCRMAQRSARVRAASNVQMSRLRSRNNIATAYTSMDSGLDGDRAIGDRATDGQCRVGMDNSVATQRQAQTDTATAVCLQRGKGTDSLGLVTHSDETDCVRKLPRVMVNPHEM